MAMVKHVAAKIKTLNKEVIKTAQRMCTSCGRILENKDEFCHFCTKSTENSKV